jgi:alpha-1,6-mannosyltransferase
MKIVDVCAFYTPHGGGVKTYVGQKLAMASHFGHDITILAPGDEDAVVTINAHARIRTIASPRFPLDRKYWYFGNEPQLHAALDEIAPDFVEAASPWRSPVMVANWRPEVPKALVMHADPLAVYAYRWFEPLMSRAVIDRLFGRFWDHLRSLGALYDAVICASHDLTSRLREGGVQGLATIPMGVDRERFSPQRRDAALRTALLAQCGLGPEATLLLSAARLAPDKRVPMLVEAVTVAGHQRPLALAIFGKGNDTATVLRAIAGNPHIRLFQPERDRANFARILASCDALVHGCEAETFCMNAAEAVASGVPVIVPDRGGAADFAGNGQGIRYRAADLGACVQAILALPPAFAGPRSPATGVRSMEEHFAELFDFYQAIARAKARQAA